MSTPSTGHAWIPRSPGGSRCLRPTRGLIGQIAPTLLESPADTLDEEWEEVGADATTGELYFLQGERLLKVGYLASSTDANGAVQLARVAMGRLTAEGADAK